jgi:hypothetical protein
MAMNYEMNIENKSDVKQSEDQLFICKCLLKDLNHWLIIIILFIILFYSLLKFIILLLLKF